ncbi:MAG: Bax inhibitor-1/YccA family protein, partial [Caulobacterales bacterium]
MNEFERAAATRSIPVGRADMAVDAGLRSFMLGVYNKLALGLVLSATLAYAAAYFPPLRDLIFGTPLYYVVAFSPIVILLVASFAMKNPSPTGAGALYWSIVTLMGLGLGVIFLVYTGVSVAKTFFITAAAFGALSLWGYTTKKDLSGMGSFLIRGLFGLIIASIVNIFLKSTAMEWAIS